MHLIDSVARHPKLKFIATQHEQAAGFASDGYARISGKPGIAISTSGPGAVNLLSGACASYFDSVPAVYLTGQVATNWLKRDRNLRQMGFQETDVCNIFKPVTKFCFEIKESGYVQGYLDSAFSIATAWRPGPVLIDLPDDIQRADLYAGGISAALTHQNKTFLTNTAKNGIYDLIQQAQRPILIIGNGFHITHDEELVSRLIDLFQWPVLTTWGGKDLLVANNRHNFGVFGTCGSRYANKMLSEADLVLSLGARLDQNVISRNPKAFAPKAKIIIVDRDEAELSKFEHIGLQIEPVKMDLADFISDIREAGLKLQNIDSWLKQCDDWENDYSKKEMLLQKQNDALTSINPYNAIDLISILAGENDIIITDAGATLAWTFQNWRIKKGQRLFSAFNHSPMGYALSASIGASVAAPHRRVICITGDGSFQMNIQELATIKYFCPNLKVFVMDNQGYGIIRQTQDIWLEGRHIASGQADGLGRVSIARIVSGYNLPLLSYKKAYDPALMEKFMHMDGPGICVIKINPDAKIIPKMGTGGNLVNMWPES